MLAHDMMGEHLPFLKTSGYWISNLNFSLERQWEVHVSDAQTESRFDSPKREICFIYFTSGMTEHAYVWFWSNSRQQLPANTLRRREILLREIILAERD